MSNLAKEAKEANVKEARMAMKEKVDKRGSFYSVILL